MNGSIFILIGATGDLSRRKIIPALYHLFLHNKLANSLLVGAALEQTTVDNLFESARAFIQDVDHTVWDNFKKKTVYQKLDIKNIEDFKELHATITLLEKQHGTTNRLLYCATAADFFCTITTHATQTGIIKKQTQTEQSWHKIIYEKPFGSDLKSAHAINQCIQKSLSEHQVFRIDHYLTKEIVSNIALVRFTNCIFEPLWNNRFIDHVQIILSESLDVENRGMYYDDYGAVRDVVQNHMLQLLALVGMEAPKKLSGDYIREQRLAVLKSVEYIDGMYGQYENYRNELGVAKTSNTETFAALRMHINNPRWSGVPFYLKTGKALEKKEAIIHIKFKSVDCLLTKQCPPDANWLTIAVEPDAGFSLTLNAKNTDEKAVLMPVEMAYCHSCRFGARSSQAYELLLQQIIRGEQSVSVRFDEIEQAWNIVDSIAQQEKNLEYYKKGSSGPEALKQFSLKHGMRWRS